MSRAYDLASALACIVCLAFLAIIAKSLTVREPDGGD